MPKNLNQNDENGLEFDLKILVIYAIGKKYFSNQFLLFPKLDLCY